MIKIVRQKIENIQFNNWMLNLTVTHFFCADETQFESLDVDIAEEKISMINDNIIKSEEWDTVRLLINSKNLNKWTSYKLLLHDIVYASVLEINLLNIFMLIEMSFHVIVDRTDSEIQSLKDHDLIIVNLIFMNNLYFLNVVKDLSMQVNIITVSKKSNHKQQQNAVRFIKI